MKENKNRVIIIAEAGVNHNGDINLAKKLIEEAANAGADYIKFQTAIASLNISKNAEKAKYQLLNTEKHQESQLEMCQKLELSFKDFEILYQHSIDNNIGFLSTATDKPSIDFLSTLNLPFFKIPSGEITNKPILEYIAKIGKPILLSSGMATLKEIRVALGILVASGLKKDQITVLHCNSEYPTPIQDVNLLAMLTIKQELDVKVGYSDHTMGIEVPIAAVALGATVIEKHFTPDNTLLGPDHKASLEPKELKAMVESIRNIESALSGSGLKEPSKSEQKNINIVRKSIVASQKINKGETFHQGNLAIKRPGTGISPMLWDEIIGKKAIRDFKIDDLIEL
jgi:N,N'-diacetyllegionaminate synthase